MKRLISCLFFILLMMACQKEMNSGVDSYDVDAIRNSNKVFNVEDSGLKFSYIPLEMSDSSLVGDIEKILLTKDYIIVRSNELIFMFDFTGKFIRRIGTQGDGPGQYKSIWDASIDESEQRLFLADYSTSKVLEYDLKGRFLNDYSYNPFWWTFEAIDGSFLINPMNLFGNEAYKIKLTTYTGDSIAYFKNDILYKSQDNLLYPTVKFFQRYHDEIVFRQQFNDSIYTFIPHTKDLVIRYYFDFGDAHFPFELLESSENFRTQSVNYGFVEDITETDDYVFLHITYKGKSEKYILRKGSDGSFYKVEKDTGVLIKTADLYFWPKWYNNERLVNYFSASEILSKRDKITDDNLIEIASSMSDESNPVVVIATIDK